MKSKNKSTKIFIISGPSGVGKTTVARGVLEKLPFLKTTVTYTTRTQRLGKKEDKTIIHVNQSEFRKKIKTGDFIEWALVHGNLYGTNAKNLKNQLAKNNLLMNIDVQGALQIKKKMPRQTRLIFLKTKTIQELIQRIERREKMPPAVLALRLKNARREMALAHQYDYIVLNEKNQINRTITQVVSLIRQELDS